MLQFATFPPDAVIVVISRSGRSVEIVKVLAKARASGATVIGITSSAGGPLARQALPLLIPIQADHAISVNTYSALAARPASCLNTVYRFSKSIAVKYQGSALAGPRGFV
jgi:glutamine---fructose-6-phosphate transaminase (isomerizing)